MKKKITLRLFYSLFSMVIGFQLSCADKREQKADSNSTAKEKKTYSDSFAIELESWSFLGDTDFHVIYNNIPNHFFERETLTIIKIKKREKQASDTLKVKLTRAQADSMYYYAQKYLSNFEMNREVVLGTRVPIIKDGANLSVALEYDNKRKEATQYHLTSIKNAAVEVDSLVSFINRQVPESYKVY